MKSHTQSNNDSNSKPQHVQLLEDIYEALARKDFTRAEVFFQLLSIHLTDYFSSIEVNDFRNDYLKQYIVALNTIYNSKYPKKIVMQEDVKNFLEKVHQTLLNNNMRIQNIFTIDSSYQDKYDAANTLYHSGHKPNYAPNFKKSLDFSTGQGAFDTYYEIEPDNLGDVNLVPYSYSHVSDELWKVASNSLRNEGIVKYDITDIDLISGSGSTELYALVLKKIFLDYKTPLGKNAVIVPTPMYGCFYPPIGLEGGEAIPVSLQEKNGFKITSEQLEQTILETNNRLATEALESFDYEYQKFLQAVKKLGVNTSSLSYFSTNEFKGHDINKEMEKVTTLTMELYLKNPLLKNKFAASGVSNLPLPPTLPRVVAIYFCNIHNPTGVAYNQDEVNALDKIRRAYDVAVIEDLTHHRIKFDSNFKLGYFGNVPEDNAYKQATLLSLSKDLCAAGSRAGLAYISKEYRQTLNSSLSSFMNNNHTTSIFNLKFYQNVFTTCLQEKALRYGLSQSKNLNSYLEKNNKIYATRSELFISFIKGLTNTGYSLTKQYEIIKKVNCNHESAIQLLFKGIPGINVLVEPQGSFFVVLDFSSFSHKYFGDMQLISSTDFYEVLLFMFNVETISGDLMLYNDKPILRFSMSLTENKIVECIERLHIFTSLIKDYKLGCQLDELGEFYVKNSALHHRFSSQLKDVDLIYQPSDMKSNNENPPFTLLKNTSYDSLFNVIEARNIADNKLKQQILFLRKLYLNSETATPPLEVMEQTLKSLTQYVNQFNPVDRAIYYKMEYQCNNPQDINTLNDYRTFVTLTHLLSNHARYKLSDTIKASVHVYALSFKLKKMHEANLHLKNINLLLNLDYSKNSIDEQTAINDIFITSFQEKKIPFEAKAMFQLYKRRGFIFQNPYNDQDISDLVTAYGEINERPNLAAYVKCLSLEVKLGFLGDAVNTVKRMLPYVDSSQEVINSEVWNDFQKVIELISVSSVFKVDIINLIESKIKLPNPLWYFLRAENYLMSAREGDVNKALADLTIFIEETIKADLIKLNCFNLLKAIRLRFKLKNENDIADQVGELFPAPHLIDNRDPALKADLITQLDKIKKYVPEIAAWEKMEFFKLASIMLKDVSLFKPSIPYIDEICIRDYRPPRTF